MNDASVPLNLLDLTVFVLYIVLIIGVGFWVARRNKDTVGDYFLAKGRLPWYAIGGSIMSANISTEHFIGMVGIAYTTGFVVCNWQWSAFIIYSLLMWFFYPFFRRHGFFTMPAYLERRFNLTARTIYSLFSICLYILALVAGVLYAGAKAMHVFFGLPMEYGILILAILTGVYTIYGGLISVAWTSFIQFVVLVVGGILVTTIGLKEVHGLGTLLREFPEHFKIYLPVDDPTFPFLGVMLIPFSLGMWYTCTNQFMVQRCLGAKTEWDGRMGVLFAGYCQMLTPFIIVLPGIIALALLPNLKDPDFAFPKLTQSVLPSGLVGVVISGLVSAIMSTISAALNSTSTLLTIDIYQRLINKSASDHTLIRFGKISSAVIMVISIFVALHFARSGEGVFLLLQNFYVWFGAPFAAIYLVGFLWKRATSAGALTGLIVSLPLTWLLQYVILDPERLHTWLHVQKHSELYLFLTTYGSWLYRTTFVWLCIIVIMIVVSLFTQPRKYHEIEDMMFKWKSLRLPDEERAVRTGFQNLLGWYCVFMFLVVGCYGFFAWLQFFRS